MPTDVNVEGVGIISFPDGMSPDQIQTILRKKFTSSPTPATDSAVNDTPKPLGDGRIYDQRAYGSLEDFVANRVRPEAKAEPAYQTGDYTRSLVAPPEQPLESDFARQQFGLPPRRLARPSGQVDQGGGELAPGTRVITGALTDAPTAPEVLGRSALPAAISGTGQMVMGAAETAPVRFSEIPGRLVEPMPGETLTDVRKFAQTEPSLAAARQAAQVQTGLSPELQQTAAAQAGQSVGSLAPLALAGPLAPAAIATQRTDQILNEAFAEAKASGMSDEQAAQNAYNKAVGAGLADEEVFGAVAPLAMEAAPFAKSLVPLDPAFRPAQDALSKFIVGRMAQSGAMGGLGFTQQAAENVAAGRPILNGTGEAAKGFAILGAVTPSKAEEPAKPFKPEGGVRYAIDEGIEPKSYQPEYQRVSPRTDLRTDTTQVRQGDGGQTSGGGGVGAGAQEPAAKAPVTGPALIGKDGKPLIEGVVGETHKQLMERGLAENADNPAKFDAIMEAMANDNQHAFVDANGNVLDRKAAHDAAVANGQTEPHATGKLFSENLKPDEGLLIQRRIQELVDQGASEEEAIKAVSDEVAAKGNQKAENYAKSVQLTEEGVQQHLGMSLEDARYQGLVRQNTEGHYELTDRGVKHYVDNGGEPTAPPQQTAPTETAPPTTTEQSAPIGLSRRAAGGSPIEEAARQDLPGVWEEAAKQEASDPGVSKRLVDELFTKPRAVDNTEIAHILRRKIEVTNEHDAAIHDVNSHPGDERAQQRLRAAEDEAKKVDQVAELARAAAGRSLGAFRLLAERDFSLSKMLAEERARVNKGEPLTPEQTKDITELHTKLKAAETKVAELEARDAFREMADAAAKERKAAAKSGEKPKPFLQNAYDNAKRRNVERRGRLQAGIDPTSLMDEAIIAAYWIERGVRNLGDFTKKMVSEIGEHVRPYIKELYDRGQQFRATAAKASGGRVPKLTEQEKLLRRETGEAKRIEKQAGKYEEAVATGDTSPIPAPKRQTAPIERKVTAQERLATAREEYQQQPGVQQRKTKEEAAASAARIKAEAERYGQKAAAGDTSPMRPEPKQTVPTQEQAAAQEERATQKAAYEAQPGVQARKATAREEAATRQVKNQAEKLKERLAAGDLSPLNPPPKPKTVSPERAVAITEVNNLKEQYLRRLYKAEYLARPRIQRVAINALEALRLARAVKTAFDVSAVARQGGFNLFAHPIDSAKAIKAMLTAMKSEAGQTRVMEEIKSRDNFTQGAYKRGGLFISDPNGRLDKMEEAFASRWAKNIPGVGMSERAYTTYLNRIRADRFDSLKNSLEGKGLIGKVFGTGRELTDKELRLIGNFVNVTTGRGYLPERFAGAAEALNTGFFAPRFVLSRFQTALGQPLWSLQGGMSPRTRLLLAGEYARTLTGIAAFIGAATAAGAKIETDPRSTDFMKLRFGDLRIDPLSGLQQAMVYMSRMWTGQTKTTGGAIKSLSGELPFGQRSAWDVTTSFLRTKLNPVVGAAVNARTGSDPTGQATSALNEALNFALPLSWRDISDTMHAQGVPKKLAFSLLAALGMGVSRYSPQTTQERHAARQMLEARDRALLHGDIKKAADLSFR